MSARFHVFGGERLQAFSDAVFAIVATIMVSFVTMEMILLDDDNIRFPVCSELILEAYTSFILNIYYIISLEHLLLYLHFSW